MTLLKKVPTFHTDSAEISGYPEWVSDLPSCLSSGDRNLYIFVRAATWADSIKHHGLHDSGASPEGLDSEPSNGFGD
jgi:hypothetical protein